MRSWFLLCAVLSIATMIAPSACGGEGANDFDAHIAPILARHCLDCHNSVDRKGSLDLSNQASAMAGGESGVVIQPSDADASLLWEKITGGEMPPEKPLSSSEADALREWINAGAPWGTA